jgi:hypothetical protein
MAGCPVFLHPLGEVVSHHKTGNQTSVLRFLCFFAATQLRCLGSMWWTAGRNCPAAARSLPWSNIATRLGQSLEFDPVSGKTTNNEEANHWIHPPRRKGWDL